MKFATLATAARPAITTTIGVLSDDEPRRRTSNSVRHERHLLGAIIDQLAKIDARRPYLRRGCSSLSTTRCASSAAATLPPPGASAPCRPAGHASGYARARRPRGGGRSGGGCRAGRSAESLRAYARRWCLTRQEGGSWSRSPTRAWASPPDVGRRGPGAGAAGRPSAPAPAAKEQAVPEPGHAVTVQDTAILAGTMPPPEPTRVGRPPRRRRRDRKRPTAEPLPGRSWPAPCHFQAVRFGPRHSGGVTTAGVATGRRPLQLPRSADQKPL